MRLEIFIGLDGLRKGKWLRDLRFEPAIGQAVVGIFLCRRELLRIARDPHQRIATNAESFLQGRKEREGCGLQREPAILKDDSTGHRGLGQLFQKWSGNRIEGDARTLAFAWLLRRLLLNL